MEPGRNRAAMLHLLGTALLIPSVAVAAERRLAPPADEIVVTAQKRAERPIDVPIALSALRPNELRSLAIESNNDLSRIVPSLSITQTAPGQNILAIRGITSAYPLAPTVAVYLDETPLDLRTDANAAAPDLELFDVARIEVLRGPQGTLFGASALGGALRIVQNQPNFEGASFHGEASASTVDSGGEGFALKAAGGAPLGDDLAFRAAVTHERFPGYARRVETSDYYAMTSADPVVARNLGRNDRTTAHFALAWKPVAEVTIEPSINYSRSSSDGANYADSNRPRYTYTGDIDGHFSDRSIIGNLLLTAALGGADLVSSTSYLNRRTRGTQDFSPVAAFLYSQLTGTTVDVPVFRMISQMPVDYREWTQEVRLSSRGSGKFRWVIGGFFEHVRDKSYQYADSDTFGPFAADLLGLPTTTRLNGFFEPIIDRQLAAFANAEFDILPRLTVSAGARVYNLHQRTTITQDGIFGGPSAPTVSSHQSGVSPRVSLSYRLSPDASIYAAFAKGFRPGSGNTILLAPPDGCPGAEAYQPTFKSDGVRNYELGGKAQSRDGRLAINGAVYQTEWRSIQAPVNTVCGSYIANIGNARIQGVEVEATVRPLTGLTLRGAVSYNDARIRSIFPEAAAVGAVRGDRITTVPRTQIHGGGEYRLPVGRDGAIYARGDVQHVGGAPTVYGSADPRAYQPAFTNVDAAIGLDRGPFEFELRAQNVLNTYQISSVFSAFTVIVPPDTVRYNVNRPRTLSLVIRYRIGD